MKVNKIMTISNKTIETRIINHITDTVASYYEVDRELYKSANRKREIIMMKHTAAYFIKKYIKDITFAKIGSYFNNLDHATVLYGINKLTGLMQFNKFVKNDIENINAILQPYIESFIDKHINKKNVLSTDKVTMLSVTNEKKVLLYGFSEREEDAYYEFFKATSLTRFDDAGLLLYEETKLPTQAVE
jgi:hypothetical protein